MVANLMMSAKLATLGLLKIKTFWNKGCDIIICVYDVTNRILSRDSNYIVDVYRNLNFIRIWPKKPHFFEGCSWFKFINFKLALGMTLKFYTSVAKGLKLKVRNFWGLVATFVEVKNSAKHLAWSFCKNRKRICKK